MPPEMGPMGPPPGMPMGEQMGMAPPMPLPQEPETPDLPDEPIPDIDDAVLLQIMQAAYETARDARATRKRLNDRNWDAVHGKFAFLTKKQPGQSAIVVSALETSLEQISAQLTQQLVGASNWFSADYDGQPPPLPGLDADAAARILRVELDRMSVEGGGIPTQVGVTRFIYDALKLGLIESVVTAKVSVDMDEVPKYEVGPGGELVQRMKPATRLRVDLIPFSDHFPDPSPARHYDIHEVEVHIADLPDLGFSDEEIAEIRNCNVGSEKQEESRKRAGLTSGMPNKKNCVWLREYWGDLIDPQTGEMLAKKAFFVTAGGSHVARKPVKIKDILWHDYRPFISIPLAPTPTAEVHHAFLDMAIPLIEVESELTNLMIDGGFAEALGAKILKEYMLVDELSVAKGVLPGQILSVKEGYPNEKVYERVDTGTVTQQMLSTLDRMSRERQQALRINDLQAGRTPQRKQSATEITMIEEAGNDLFSNMALRFEDTFIEPMLELLWLTLWQFADESMVARMAPTVGAENGEILTLMKPAERFVAFASAALFKVQGYKYQLQAMKNWQKWMAFRQQAMTNQALMSVLQGEVSPIKEYKMGLQALGIDPNELRPEPGEPSMDPALMAGQSGNPGQNPQAGQNEAIAPPNALGERGSQIG